MTDFESAMIVSAMEEVAGKPCVMCSNPGNYVGVFFPGERCAAEDLGFRPDDPGQQIVYSLCGRCSKKFSRSQAFMDRVENVLIAQNKRK